MKQLEGELRIVLDVVAAGDAIAMSVVAPSMSAALLVTRLVSRGLLPRAGARAGGSCQRERPDLDQAVLAERAMGRPGQVL